MYLSTVKVGSRGHTCPLVQHAPLRTDVLAQRECDWAKPPMIQHHWGDAPLPLACRIALMSAYSTGVGCQPDKTCDSRGADDDSTLPALPDQADSTASHRSGAPAFS